MHLMQSILFCLNIIIEGLCFCNLQHQNIVLWGEEKIKDSKICQNQQDNHSIPYFQQMKSSFQLGQALIIKIYFRESLANTVFTFVSDCFVYAFQRIIYCYKNQQIHMSQKQWCVFCSSSSRFEPIITTALFDKYSTSTNYFFSRTIDDLVNNSCIESVIHYQEILMEINSLEFLKREYGIEEFPYKMEHYSQYYKFNRDFPRCFHKQLVSPLMRYQERVKKLDFRKVKNAIKRQQGISITSQNSESSIDESNQQTKSQYDNVLTQIKLQQSTDSVALNNICAEIGNAFAKTKTNHLFKGSFQEQSKNFEVFLEKQRKKSIWQRKSHLRPLFAQSRDNKNTGSQEILYFKGKTLINQKQLPCHNSQEDKFKKEKCQKVNSFRRLEKDQFSKTLHNFYKAATGGKYNSIKENNLLNANHNRLKSKSLRKSQTKKTPSTTKLSKEQKPTIQTDRFHREDSKKVLRRNSTLKPTQELRYTPSNQNHNGYLGNQNVTSKQKGMKKEVEDKSLSRSKSKTHLSKDGLRSQSSKRITRTPSTLNENSMPKIKVVEKSKEINKMSNLINKKLALYLKC